MSLYIKNATIITMDPKYGTVHGGLIIENGTIHAIVDAAQNQELDRSNIDEEYDADGYVIIPGLINSHYHSYANLLKGFGNDLPLEIWSIFTVAYGQSLDEEGSALAVTLGTMEMMKNGITCCLDHFPHLLRTESALMAYQQSGMRVIFAPMLQDIPDYRLLPVSLPIEEYIRLEKTKPKSPSDMLTYYEDLIQRWHGKDAKIQIAVGPNAPQRCSEGMLQIGKQLSQTNHLHLHTHLLETKIQANLGGAVHLLEKIGMLDSPISLAHSVWLKPEEMNLIEGKPVTIVHNPASNMILGSGKAPILEYLKRGISVALGTDASNCGTEHNLFETMRLALMLQRSGETDYRKWLHHEDVFRMATIGGAKAVGMERKIGILSPGACADLVLLKKDSISLTPLNNLLKQIVYYGNGRDVESVMINGQWTIKNGKFVTLNEKQIIQKAKMYREKMKKGASQAVQQARQQQPYFERMYREFFNLE
ncbi:amidohydrolase family protein [Terrilactibacillus laevilacticus]|uniref:amidohydrolase family protein n=1 Tax=Terrilactibacillus laevilacticus TaxID=1380157 RepID=UPI0015EED1C1|nr:amidohydrolase family protein [Terrilactibacillus laevilacticus]